MVSLGEGKTAATSVRFHFLRLAPVVTWVTRLVAGPAGNLGPGPSIDALVSPQSPTRPEGLIGALRTLGGVFVGERLVGTSRQGARAAPCTLSSGELPSASERLGLHYIDAIGLGFLRLD
jgi:hypothetical protein